jgi:hypothetical protein
MRLILMALLTLLGTTLLTTPQADAAMIQINSDNDDAYEEGDGTFNATGFTVDIFSHTDVNNANYRCSGFRFENVRLDSTDEVDNASIELYINTNLNMNALIFAENTGNSVDFDTNANIIDNAQRPKTENYVFWIENGLAVNTWENSDNIAGMITEVISHPDWTVGNSITILIMGNEDQNLSADARSHDFLTTLGARLWYTFQPTIGNTGYPEIALPRSVIHIRQQLVSNGVGFGDVNSTITFSETGFQFISDYPENDNTIENCADADIVVAEWYVSPPHTEDNYEFYTTWGIFNGGVREIISDNFTIDVRYPENNVTYGNPGIPTEGSADAISIVAIGIAIVACALAIARSG